METQRIVVARRCLGVARPFRWNTGKCSRSKAKESTDRDISSVTFVNCIRVVGTVRLVGFRAKSKSVIWRNEATGSGEKACGWIPTLAQLTKQSLTLSHRARRSKNFPLTPTKAGLRRLDSF
ncbi:hypothetical protein AVEN_178675-1 [Araneus ventricosus]|uniref:Uncharacterized protein n=1 Tax=Araneus ventricosus TaxID=182803 RepID=A0A4Y2I8W3_ARAVE|nr:hypothetical protein AVEN_178675-1 [Araneus ventricosus]